MRRVLSVLLAGAVTLALAWALASLPGRVSAEIGEFSFEAATPVVALGLLLLFALLYAAFRLLGALVRLPRTLRERRAVRRRRTGDAALTRTLLALAAGETGDARREASRARRLLGDTPATLLLAAEAGRIAGRDDEAETAFRALADRRDAAFLGLRGLLRQAIEREDWAEATALARQAEAVEPGAAWLRRERFRLAVRAGEWSDALALADADAPKAALAAAAAEAESDAGRALRLAKQAWKADPSLSPAALAYATRLRAAGRERRALVVIRHSWAIAPHPDLADFALAPVSDTLQRDAGGAAADRGQSGPCRKPPAAGAHGPRGRPDRRGAPPRRGRRRDRSQPAPAVAAAGGDRGGGRRRQRDRPPGAAGCAAPRRRSRSRSDVAVRCLPHRARVMAPELSGLLHRRQPALAHGSGGDAAHSPGPRGNNPYRERLTNCYRA